MFAAAVTAVVGLGVTAFVVSGGDDDRPGLPRVGGDLHSLVAHDGRLYVGGHDAVAVSDDGGATWEGVASLDGADAMGWAFLDGRAYVGGHPGLFVSDDQAAGFQRRNEGLPATDIHALGGGGGLLYGASPLAGVFASTDGGQTWKARSADVGQSFMGRIVVDPRDAERLVAPDATAGAVESRDGGRLWRALGGLPAATWVSASPDDFDTIVASAPGTAQITTDGGATWRPLDVPDAVRLVEFDARDADTMYGAAHVGEQAEVWVSHDAGRSWQRAAEGA